MIPVRSLRSSRPPGERSASWYQLHLCVEGERGNAEWLALGPLQSRDKMKKLRARLNKQGFILQVSTHPAPSVRS